MSMSVFEVKELNEQFSSTVCSDAMVTFPYDNVITNGIWATVKDTGDVVEEVLILKTPLVTDFVHRLQEESLSQWPIVLQEDDHVT